MAQHGSHTHSHMWLVGVLGLSAGLLLLIYVPSLPAVSRTLLFFAGFHLCGPSCSAHPFTSWRATDSMRQLHGRQAIRFDFGWTPAWTIWTLDCSAHRHGGRRRASARRVGLVAARHVARVARGKLLCRRARHARQ